MNGESYPVVLEVIPQTNQDDSMKKFEQCTLCLNILTDPLSCDKGHIFCKSCIIENLLFQKREIKKKVAEWKSKGPSKELQKLSDQTDDVKKIVNLKSVEEGVVNLNEEISLDQALMSESDLKRFEMIKDFEKKKSTIFNRDKTELTRNCFWIPDLTPNCVVEEEGKPCEKTVCPAAGERDRNHFIRLKELINLKMVKDENDDKFLCKVCKKELSYQKIVALYTCGEVFCKKCLEITAKKDNRCPSCSKAFSDFEIIDLKESGSGFSFHNSVETTKLNPYFKC